MIPMQSNRVTNQNGGRSDIRAAAYEEALGRLRDARLFSQRLTRTQAAALTSMEADEIGTPEVLRK